MRRHFPVSEVFRKDVRSRVDNPYRRRRKYPSGTVCPDCGLLFSKGVWRWATAAARPNAPGKRCPACLQIRDNHPCGVLRLSGAFVARHRRDILNRVRSLERRALREHPLERLFRPVEDGGDIVLHSTEEHLVSRIGKALRRDYGGILELKYGPQDQCAIVSWSREE